MNDRTKHRIVGIVVIAAFLVILVPALMKNSFWSESNEGNNMHGQENKYAVESEQPMSSPASSEPESFQTNQIAQVSLDQPSTEQPLENPITSSATTSSANSSDTATTTQTQSTQSMESMKSTAEPVPEATMESPVPAPPPTPVITSQPKPKPKTVVASQPQPAAQKAQPKPMTSQPVVQKATGVCFQLGTFSNANNVQALLKKLKAEGFPTVKATPVSLGNGQKVQRVSLCQAMAHEAIPQVRAKLTKLVGTAPMVTK